MRPHVLLANLSWSLALASELTCVTVAGAQQPPLSIGLLLAAPADVASARPEAPDHDHAFRVYVSDAQVDHAARRALRLAAARLGLGSCEGLVDEYHSGTGHALRRTLERLGMTMREYLGVVTFVNGSASRPCRADVLAYTRPGSRVVALCGAEFTRLAGRNVPEASVAIIHEVLHTLGLGENPPSALDISLNVRRRCW